MKVASREQNNYHLRELDEFVNSRKKIYFLKKNEERNKENNRNNSDNNLTKKKTFDENSNKKSKFFIKNQDNIILKNVFTKNNITESFSGAKVIK